MDLIERAAKLSKKKKEEPKAPESPFKGIGRKKSVADSEGSASQESKDVKVKGIGKPKQQKTPDPTAIAFNYDASEAAKQSSGTKNTAGIRALGGNKTGAPQGREIGGLEGNRKKRRNLSEALEGSADKLKPTKLSKKEDAHIASKAGSAIFKEEASQPPEIGEGEAEIAAKPILTKKQGARVKDHKPTVDQAKHSKNYEELDILKLREEGYITPDSPPNLMSEEFRMIKRTILLNAFSGGENSIERGNVIMMTSSNPNEGKTFCSINLALSIATEQDTTVLLIDADFSKPEILNRVGLRGGKGIMDVVADESLSLADCLVRTNIPNLVVMPAGRQHNRTTELLASERMIEIVDDIANRYPDRIVIFDAPPALASSVPSVLSLHVGQVVFVIEAESTSEPQIKESLTMLNACKHISLMLNKTRVGSSNKKFATYYGYGGR